MKKNKFPTGESGFCFLIEGHGVAKSMWLISTLMAQRREDVK